MKQLILDNVLDLVGELLYYGRKEDESLKRGDIEESIASGEITIDEIVNTFEKELRDSIR